MLSIQQESWQRFWEKDINELFTEISPIRDYTGKEFELSFLDYELGKPKYKNDLEAKQNNDSFEASLRVKIRLVDIKTKQSREQEVFLCDFPLMTERGTFVINGVERVVISQLIRSPGAFFTMQTVGNKKHFGAKIIPNRGAWLEFETERTGFIGVRIDRKRKVAATTLLKALGAWKSEIRNPKSEKNPKSQIQNSKNIEKNIDAQIKELFVDVDKGETNYIEETLERDSAQSQDEAAVEIYKRLRPGDLAAPDTARELIKNMFFNFSRYDLSKVGRWKFWQRLPEPKLKVKNEKLKVKVKSLKLEKKEDKKEEITTEDRVLHPEDVMAVVREIIRLNNDPDANPDQIDHLGNRRVRVLNELLQNRLRVGLMRMERIIKDRMSTLEPDGLMPAQLINPRPFMAVLREFFMTSQVSQFMDNQNPLAELEHKRRLSATGPGGLARERAGFEVRDVQTSHYGRICPIQTPEGPNIGLVGHLAGYAKINAYGFIETPYFRVKKGRVTRDIQYLSAYEEERYNIAHAGVNISSKGEIVSKRVAARLKGKPGVVDRKEIDFIDVSPEQCISLATSLIPFLQNDDATRALMGSNMQRQSVPVLNPEPPLVGTGLEVEVARDSGLEVLSDRDGVVEEVDADHIKIRNVKMSKYRNFELKTFIRTNQYTCFHQTPIVKKGDKVKTGDVLADGGAAKNGRLALGQNVLVAFMPWQGGNFEDAIIISEKLSRQDAYTSIHIENFSCDIRETKLGPEVTTSDIPNVGEEKLKDLDEEGIIRIGAEVSPNDILVGKISPKGEAGLTAEERLLQAIFGEKAREVKDSSLLMEHGKRGRVVAVKIFSREAGHKLEPGIIKKVEVEVMSKRKITAGDKLAGRHGNKGVISMVLPEEEMPFMEDGTPVDIILNPLSVASRMNLGQILETHLGWAAKKLGYLAVTPALSGATESDIKSELKKAGLSEDGKVFLRDGRSGEVFPQKITVGYIYVMKLIHMVEDKVFARSIGPYSLITQQPLGGKAQFGGQRFGEMEVWALEGYGASHILQEMLTIKSDDVLGRAITYEAILKGEKIHNPRLPASFNLLVNELKSLGLSVEVKEKREAPEK